MPITLSLGFLKMTTKRPITQEEVGSSELSSPGQGCCFSLKSLEVT